jgi:hypothetical protein
VDVVPVFLQMTVVHPFVCIEIINKKCNFCGNVQFVSAIYFYGLVASSWKVNFSCKYENNSMTLNLVLKYSFMAELSQVLRGNTSHAHKVCRNIREGLGCCVHFCHTEPV